MLFNYVAFLLANQLKFSEELITPNIEGTKFATTAELLDGNRANLLT